MKKHNFIPRTQWQNFEAAVKDSRQPSNNFEDDGATPMQPMLTLSGSKKNDVIVSLDAAIAPTSTGAWMPDDAATLTITATQLALYFRGMLAQNAAKFQ